MKKAIFTLAIIMMSGLLAFAQNSGKGFNYQAIARDINGQVLQNETITLRFSLIRQNETDPTWQEKQATITDEFGAFSLTIGQGVRFAGLVDEYNEVNFEGLPFWLKVELEDDEDYYEISFRELISVPYAEVALNATLFSPGMIIPYAGLLNSIPDGWLLCDGSLLEKNTYPALYAALGNSWGGTTTHFNLPDCRGNFLRGVSYASNRDEDKNIRIALSSGGNTGNNVGSYQSSQFLSHTHTMELGGAHTHDVYNGSAKVHWGDGGGYSTSYIDAGTNSGSGSSYYLATGSASPITHKHTINANGGLETRPENIYVNYIIKY